MTFYATFYDHLLNFMPFGQQRWLNMIYSHTNVSAAGEIFENYRYDTTENLYINRTHTYHGQKKIVTQGSQNL